MVEKNGVRIQPNKTLLSEVTFEHLSDAERKMLVDVGFERVRIIIESSDPLARRDAALDLTRDYLEQVA